MLVSTEILHKRLENADNKEFGNFCSRLAILGIKIEDYPLLHVKHKVFIVDHICGTVTEYDVEAENRELRLYDIQHFTEDYDDLPESEKERIGGAALVCRYCSRLIFEDEHMDQVLYVYDDSYWGRLWGHSYCAAYGPLEERLNPFTLQETMLEFLSKRDKSAQILMLLQAVGLPWDVAWPVTALACWML